MSSTKQTSEVIEERKQDMSTIGQTNETIEERKQDMSTTGQTNDSIDEKKIAEDLTARYEPRLPRQLAGSVDVEFWIERVAEARGMDGAHGFAMALSRRGRIRHPLSAAKLIASIDYSNWGPEVIAEAWIVCAALVAELGEEQRLREFEDYRHLMGLA